MFLTEEEFEKRLEQGFLENEWQRGTPSDYDEKHGLFVGDLMAFLANSQPKNFAQLKKKVGDSIEEVVIETVKKHIKSDLITNLKNLGYEGLDIKGIKFDLIIDKPKSTNNPETLEQYKQNITKIYRQVSFNVDMGSTKHNRPDVILSLNGFPLVLIELKSTWTQSIHAAMNQFKEDRRPSSNILYQFNRRALAYIAMTEKDIYVTTKLEGKDTRFLPFNSFEAHEETKLKAAYLWEQVFTRDSFIDIVCNFIFKDGDNLIFPRLHQWDAVDKLTRSAIEKSVSKNYLIQHSAGSGKSKTISWLAHKLASLHDVAGAAALYDSIIVLVDRRVLDNQLKAEISGMAKNKDAIAEVKTTEELVLALNKRAKIIISTIQKFNFISKVLYTKSDINFDIKKHKFAIIIDEAHSSQGSETTKSLNKTLNANGISAAVSEFIDNDAEEGDDYYGTYESDVDREMKEEALAQKSVQDNLSIFAFTATPKYKTLIAFGERPGSGETYFKPFHLYSMKQAISEGFILDVLQNYTIYETYYKLNKKIADDPEMETAKTTRAVLNYAKLHPQHIAQKIEIIAEHFIQSVASKIGGQAKAMVVTSSREEALRYKEAFDAYLIEKKIQGVKTLVAFSGELERDGRKVSEVSINKMAEDKLTDAFGTNEYQVLLVASKYQTGFDEPKLHTMYVLKPLSGVNAVQTLSRLNRICKGKVDTCVIDFANSKEDIYKAFKPFYEKSQSENNIDEFSLKEMRASIAGFDVFTLDDVEKFAKKSYSKGGKKSFEVLGNAIEDVCKRINALAEDKKEDFKNQLIAYTKLYSYISSLVVLDNPNDAKHFHFFLLLLKVMKNAEGGTPKIDPAELVELVKVQTKYIESMNIKLDDGETGEVRGPSDANGKGSGKEDKLLSLIIEKINAKLGEESAEATKNIMNDFTADAKGDSQFMTLIKNNLAKDSKKKWDDKYGDILLARHETTRKNAKVLEVLRTDEEINSLVSEAIYQKLANLESLGV